MKPSTIRAVLVVVGISIVALALDALFERVSSIANAPTPVAIDWCSEALADAPGPNESWSSRKTYQRAVSGLSKYERCDQPALRQMAHGILLGQKALSEYDLHGDTFDAETDLNEAISIFARCQIDPDATTEQAAQCETAEDGLEKAKVAESMKGMLPSPLP